MNTLILTLAIAFIVIVVALALLGISWLMTGQCKLRPGACGRDPTRSKEPAKGCGTETSCHLCKQPEDKTKK